MMISAGTLHAERVRVLSSPSGRASLAHLEEMHPARPFENSNTLAEGQFIYDLDRRECFHGRMPKGRFLRFAGGGDPRFVGRLTRAFCCASWSPDESRVAVLLAAEDRGLSLAVWAANGGETVSRSISGSLLGFRSEERVRAPGFTWSAGGRILALVRAHTDLPAVASSSFGRGWSPGFVDALWSASSSKLVALDSGSEIVGDVVVVDWQEVGGRILLGYARSAQDLYVFLRDNTLNYSLVTLTESDIDATNIGRFSLGAVYLKCLGNFGQVVEFDCDGGRTSVRLVRSASRLAAIDGEIEFFSGVPGVSGAWTVREQPSTLHFVSKKIDLPGPYRCIDDGPGKADVVRICGVCDGGEEFELYFDTKAECQSVEVEKLVDRIESQVVSRSPAGEVSSQSDSTRPPLLEMKVSSYANMRVCGAPGRAPLLWLTPLATERCMPYDSNAGAQMGYIVPGSPEWVHLSDRPVVNLRVALGWREDVCFDALEKRVVQSIEDTLTALKQLGFISDGRWALGGHSFGASVASVALCSQMSPAAAILRSGSFDRFYTPMGFQFESRALPDAVDVYEGFSTLRRAKDISCPVLLTHGLCDVNEGTRPDQSRAMFRVLSSYSHNVRLVELPYEGHDIVGSVGIGTIRFEERDWLLSHVDKD